MPKIRKSRAEGESLPQGSDDEDDPVQFDLPEQQDPQVRREIRRKYRLLYEETQKNQQELISPHSTQLHETLLRTNEIFKDVRNPREGAQDAQLLAVISNFGRQQAQALHTDLVVFEPAEFVNKLTTFICGEQLEKEASGRRITKEGWEKLGDVVQPFFSRSPALHFMFGSFKRGPKQWTPKKKKETKPVSADDPKDGQKNATIPTQLKNIKEKVEATTAEVERIHGTLLNFYKEWDKQPICFFEFVVNPFSYGQTIENIFYASFLVRDGYAQILNDGDRLPVIIPVEKKDGEIPRDDVKRHQVVMALNYNEWKAIVRRFEIQEPMIPTRTPLERRDGNPPPAGSGEPSCSWSEPLSRPVLNGIKNGSDEENEGPAPPRKVSKKRK